ncbi:MAG: tRNA uridine-5-carboxymethylaminomethyl(34) synthesis GTPase MnmE [Phyllobacterium sp.]
MSNLSQHSYADTIYAVSSGRLPAGIAVIRISGSQTQKVLMALVGSVPPARNAVLRNIRNNDGMILDSGLVLYFPGPASFTGEDSAELQVHGSVAVVDALLAALSSCDGCRMADPGEFTRRAFANGKMDLTMAEGLADLINAETESQRRLAFQISSGAQRDLYAEWRKELIQARALIEAELDFADEADVPGSVSNMVWPKLENLSKRISVHIEDGRKGSIVRDGFHIAIVGAPNAGKSSLLNVLAGAEVAIVSDEAGTTRDLIEVRLNLGGVMVFVTDTAGLRETDQKVEKIGIERALRRAESADLVLLLNDLNEPERTSAVTGYNSTISIGTKLDLANRDQMPEHDHRHLISVETGEGIPELIDELKEIAITASGDSTDPLPTRRRHLDLLNSTYIEIDNAITRSDIDLELRAEHLRLASSYLGRITGDVDVEEILDVVFSEFCIGK